MHELNYKKEFDIEKQIREIGEEDRKRLKEKMHEPNLYERQKMENKVNLKKYQQTNYGNYSGSGCYYKLDPENGEYFLSRYYNSKGRKYAKHQTNKKVRQAKADSFCERGAGYRKLFDYLWNIT